MRASLFNCIASSESEEMLDWRNYNGRFTAAFKHRLYFSDREKKRMGTDSVTPRGGLRTGLYRSNENAKENESSQDARGITLYQLSIISQLT